MTAYYIRMAFSYIPAIMLWIAFLYMMAIFKQPEVIADLLSEERPIRRKVVCTIIFLVFAIVFAAGFGTLLKDTRPMQDWHEGLQYLAIGAPWLFGSGLAGAFMVGIGLETAERVEQKKRDYEREERQNRWRRDE